MKRIIILFCITLFAATHVAQAQLIRHSQTLITKTKTEKPKKERVKKVLDPVQPGYQQTISVSGILDLEDHIGVGLSYVGGYRFNNTLYIGVGVQGEYMIHTYSPRLVEWGGWFDEVSDCWRDTETCVLREGLHGASNSEFCLTGYAHARAYLSKRRFQPYVGASLGYSFCDAGAVVIAPEVGFDQRMTNKTSFNFGAGLWRHGEYNFLKINLGLTF